MTSLADVISLNCNKIIISSPRLKNAEYRKITITKSTNDYMAEKLTRTKAFHEKILDSELLMYCESHILGEFSQLNAWDEGYEYNVLASKKGKLTIKKAALVNAAVAAQGHNRTKNYIIAEGEIVPALVDMGVFTAEGKIVSTMHDKYRQINRFIEIIDDAIPPQAKSLSVVDFGCGKSYLTFILYHYLTQIKGIDAQVTGLDLKKDVIEKCNTAAIKYGYDKLKFEVGDINGYKPPFAVDMVISLHACDTATDYALFNAVSWGARLIFSAPCCQHELNEQLTAQGLEILSRYGIIKERFAALATDAIRANLLTAAGYKTQVLEFVDFAHTPKNLLLRAVRCTHTKATKEKAKEQVGKIMQDFSFEPTLHKLLTKAGLL